MLTLLNIFMWANILVIQLLGNTTAPNVTAPPPPVTSGASVLGFF